MVEPHLGERLPFAETAALARKRTSYGYALPTTNHIEPLFIRRVYGVAFSDSFLLDCLRLVGPLVSRLRRSHDTWARNCRCGCFHGDQRLLVVACTVRHPHRYGSGMSLRKSNFLLYVRGRAAPHRSGVAYLKENVAFAGRYGQLNMGEMSSKRGLVTGLALVGWSGAYQPKGSNAGSPGSGRGIRQQSAAFG